MAQNETLAVIDIGSNAIRMVIASRDKTQMKILKKFRFPIRLGADVFEKGKISGKNLKTAARTFEQFREVSDEFKVRKIKAVGTSALREASNKKQFIELIRRRSGIQIECIDGVQEAQIIFTAVKHEIDLEHHRVLLIDIGGGSVELTFAEKSQMQSTQSFPFGTVRTLELLKKKKAAESQISAVLADYAAPLSNFLKSQSIGPRMEFAVGTGGNIDSLSKLKSTLLGKNAKSFLTSKELEEIVEILKKTSMKDRIEKLNLRPDRADVILPAALLVLMILKTAGIEKILVPSVGLKEGLLWELVRN